ncbi:MAG: deoxynucleoside kinase [Reichenbachiella sp.]
MHIAIAGNIGAGKSSLAKLLASRFNWNVEYEVVDTNPYLEDYYQDMKRWAFEMQVYFLNSRFEQLKVIQNSNTPIIQDRSIYEDAYVFAKSLFEQGILSSRGYNNYLRLFNSMIEQITPPDLLIYLRSSVNQLQVNIQKRARHYEKKLPESYLESLNQHYENWIHDYLLGPILIIPNDSVDFVKNENELNQIISQVQESFL